MRRVRLLIIIVLFAAALPVARDLGARRAGPAAPVASAPGPPSAAAGPPAAAPSTPAAPARLRLATWNIAWLNRAPGGGRVRRSAADYERLRRHAGRIDADVVALQEIDGPPAARRLFDDRAWVLHLTGDEDNPQRTGFAIRSGIPVTRHPDVLAFAAGGRRRGADITVHLRGGDLRLLSIHLKNGCHDDPLTGDRQECAILRRQHAVLEEWVDSRAREAAAFGVIGDFNRRFEPPDRFWADLDDGDPPEAELVAVTEGRRPTCWGGRYDWFIDHIVLSRKASGWLVPGSFRTVDYDAADAPFEAVLSDHCPIVVEIDSLLPPPAAPPRIRPDEAADRIGETATVCGRVAGAAFMKSIHGRPTFVNLDRPYPDQPFTVVIWGDDRAGFGAPESDLPGRSICVTGLIRAHRGKPEIALRRPADLVIEAGTGAEAGSGTP